MSKNERCENMMRQLQEQISITGTQVRQKMKTIQMDLLAEIEKELDNGNNKGIDLH